MFGLVVDATGSLSAMRRSPSLTGHGGALVLVGVALGDLAFEDTEFHKREATLIASRNALSSDFERVIAAIKSGDIPTDRLQIQTVDAADLPTRLPDLIGHADSVLKAIASFYFNAALPDATAWTAFQLAECAPAQRWTSTVTWTNSSRARTCRA